MILPEFQSTFFINNRNRLADLLPEKSALIIHSSDQMPRTGDQFYKYRQNSDFFYLTGISQEQSTLILCPNHPDPLLQSVLIIRKSDKQLEIWEGHKLTPIEASQISGVEQVKFQDQYEQVIHLVLMFATSIFINIPELAKFKHEIADRNERMFHQLKSKYPLHSYNRAANFFTQLRLIKQNKELEMIKTAISITAKGFSRVLRNITPGMKEYEVAADLIYEFIRNGADGHAFQPIVASGKNGCILHYEENNKVMKSGDLVLIDFGAEYNNYSSDCSRTIPINGKYTHRQREVYNSCLNVFKFARTLLKPGLTINEWHQMVIHRWEDEHIKLGLYKKGDEEIDGVPSWFNYYMHGTGHFMGLDTHDVGGKDVVMEPGMVITCEPGIYISEEGLGVRIENDILITSKGYIDLMDQIPVEPDDIEKLMARVG